MTLQAPSEGKAKQRGRPRSSTKGDSGRLPYDQQVAAREDADRRLAERLNSGEALSAQVFGHARRASGVKPETESQAEPAPEESANPKGAIPKGGENRKSRKWSKTRSKSRSKRGSRAARRNRRTETASAAGS